MTVAIISLASMAGVAVAGLIALLYLMRRDMGTLHDVQLQVTQLEIQLHTTKASLATAEAHANELEAKLIRSAAHADMLGAQLKAHGQILADSKDPEGLALAVKGMLADDLSKEPPF